MLAGYANARMDHGKHQHLNFFLVSVLHYIMCFLHISIFTVVSTSPTLVCVLPHPEAVLTLASLTYSLT